jgi:hypothetical protein
MKEEKASGATRVQLYHKKKTKARIREDTNNRIGLRRKLEVCMDPMKPEDHPDSLCVNIMRGKIVRASVNVDSVVKIGGEMLEEFEMFWFEGFYSTISKNVGIMAATCESVYQTCVT